MQTDIRRMAGRRGAALLALVGGLTGTAGAQTIAITGGTVYPVSGPRIENGTVVITGGRITAVGANVPIPAGARRVDATGRWVTPGLVVAGTQLGLAEAGGPQFSGGYNDASAAGRARVAASFDAYEGVNPASTFIIPQWKDGVTAVGIFPTGGAAIAGRAAVLDLGGSTIADMLVKPRVAMIAGWSPEAAEARSRGELMARMRTLLADVKSYAGRKSAYEDGATREYVLPRSELEALIPVVTGAQRLLISADRASDIRMALALATEFSLKIGILDGAEAWQVAGELAAAKVPVFVGALNNIPTSFAELGKRQENAALLRRAGVTVVLVNNGPGMPDNFNVRNIRQEAGNAVAYGLSWDEALRAITLAPAEVLGVADRIGSLQPGRDADVVVWDGDPFEFSTRATAVFIRGREMAGESRQDLLAKRYLRLPPDWR